MPTAATKYRRLPGKKRGVGGWRTLWMGDDHLLAVESNGYAEKYTRYYFKDIRAIIVRRTSARAVWNGVLAAALGVSLLPLLSFVVYGTYPPGALASICCAASLLLILLLVNTLRGPSCRCHILMPLGVRELPTLRRIRTARRTLDRLRPLIVQRQVMMTASDAAAGHESPTVEPAPRSVGPLGETLRPPFQTADPVPGSVPGVSAGGTPCPGSAHYASFSLLVAQGFLGCILLKCRVMPLFAVYGFLTLGLYICLLTAVVKQHGRPVPHPAGRLVWAALMGLTGAMFFGYYAGMVLRVMNAKGNGKPEADVAAIVSTVVSHPYFAYGILCFSVFGVLTGAFGLLSCRRRGGGPGGAGDGDNSAVPRDAVS
jgi:hypothetical protein